MLLLDASVIFDLERGGLLEAAFKLDDPFVTPDLLYVNELETDAVLGPRLRELGLKIVDLDDKEVEAAQTVARLNKSLSRPDSWAVVCARRPNHRLICGDANLRSQADADGTPCSGLLWLLDRMHDAAIVTPQILVDGLTTITRHQRARLPKAEVERRLALWKGEAGRLTAREPQTNVHPTSFTHQGQ